MNASPKATALGAQLPALLSLICLLSEILMKILILSALPQEYAPLKKIFPAFRLVRKKPCKKFAMSLAGKEITLVESGMGDKALREALCAELAPDAPDLLMFSGFAGGLHPGLPAGAVCFAAKARPLETGTLYTFTYSNELARFLAEHRIRTVLALSAGAPCNKQSLCALFAGELAVLDMETAFAAEVAFSSEIPLVCFRAVSDPVDHDLGFNLEDISDGQGKVRPHRVLATILKKPSTLISFYRLWRGSNLAAKNLCATVAAFLNLPEQEMGKIAREIKIKRS